MPRIGIFGPNFWIISLQTPKYFFSVGDPGPGEIIILSGLSSFKSLRHI